MGQKVKIDNEIMKRKTFIGISLLKSILII
jgi:hypothetical protein